MLNHDKLVSITNTDRVIAYLVFIEFPIEATDGLKRENSLKLEC